MTHQWHELTNHLSEEIFREKPIGFTRFVMNGEGTIIAEVSKGVAVLDYMAGVEVEVSKGAAVMADEAVVEVEVSKGAAKNCYEKIRNLIKIGKITALC